MPGPRQPHSEQVHAEKYRLDGESFEEGMRRIASGLADDEVHRNDFLEPLMEMRFMPAGRVQTAIGSPKNVTAFNCFVAAPIHDSFVHGRDGSGLDSIMDIARQAASTMRMGGGIGYDFSTLRPSGARIEGVQSKTDGPLAFMPIFDAICRATSSAGNRRGAQMGVLRIDHPDIVAFIRAKQPSSMLEAMWEHVDDLPGDHPNRMGLVSALQETLRLTGFNLSLGITDEFMDCLQTGRPFALRFGGTTHSYIDPHELWELVMRSTWDWAEPGVLFIDRINDMNNLRYCETIAATNPCVPAGTPILTRRGWQPIDELVGEKVEVWNGEEWSEVEPRPTGVDQPLVTVRLSNGQELTCTTAHGFVLADGTRAEARELRAGDELLELEWPVVEGGADIPEAYTQGAFAGDGWYASSERPYLSFKREDKKVIEPRLVFKNAYDTKQGYRFYYLRGVELREKTFVPGVEWSVRSRLDWLAGLLDTDGSVNWTKSAKEGDNVTCSAFISSVDKQFIDDLALMLRTLGVPTSRDEDTRGKRGFNTSGKTCYRLAFRSNYVKKLVEMGLHTSRIDFSRNNPLRFIKTKVVVEEVISAGQADVVFCFTEPKKHRGCFNGVLSRNCGEQPLPPHGACLLGSYNLARYITTSRSFDWQQFRADIPAVTRAMDNVVDVTLYPLREQQLEAQRKRRMGMGVTGLANAAEAMGMLYGDTEFLEFENDVLTVLRDETYQASMELAREKGAFPMFDSRRYCESEFIKTLPPSLRGDIARNGVRNSHLTSVAPTGTISYCADNVSSSIEPVFMHEGQRRMKTKEGDVIVDVLDYGLLQFGVRGRSSADVTVQQHVDVLCTAALLVDSAVSKTCNVPPDMPWEDFKAVYTSAYEGGAKGCTTFNPGGRRLGIFIAKETRRNSEDQHAPELILEASPSEAAGLTCEIGPDGRRSCE